MRLEPRKPNPLPPYRPDGVVASQVFMQVFLHKQKCTGNQQLKKV